MLFNSSEFVFYFLPLTVIGYYALGYAGFYRVSLAWLVAASLFYYGWWDPRYLGLIIASIAVNYVVGRLLGDLSHTEKWRRFILAGGVCFNLALLGFFKYVHFFLNNIRTLSGWDCHIGTIVLPLGISFFTFQQIAYLVDAYRGEVSEHNVIHYALFVTYFPQLIAGPIVHHKEMMPQFARRVALVFQQALFTDGFCTFVIGLFKKVVLADQAALYVTPVFSAAANGVPLTFFEAWSAVLAYTFQIYFDFSGYSDMAIGIGKMFGIHLPVNFHSPYKSLSIIEFWRRWHITLSRFLKDYLYIPIGGNRAGEWNRYRNIMITMLLGGLWHGAGWTFVLWGGLHGVYLLINHGWRVLARRLTVLMTVPKMIRTGFSWSLTFFGVMLGWVLFRAESFDAAGAIYRGMAGVNGISLPSGVLEVVPFLEPWVRSAGTIPLLGGGTVMGVFTMTGMFLLMFMILAAPATQEMKSWQKLLAVVPCFTLCVQAVWFSRTPSEFIYFQF